MKINKIKIVLSCAVILLFVWGGIAVSTTTSTESNITPVIRILPPPKPVATVQMEFEPTSLTMKRGESKVITIILNCCVLSKFGIVPDEELGKIKTVKIALSVGSCIETGKLQEGVAAKFNPEYLTLKLNQTAYSNLTVSVNNTAESGTCPLYINLYDNNSTPDMYVSSITPYYGGSNNVNFTIIDTGLPVAETAAATSNLTALQTAIPKTSAFEAFSAIAALLVVLLIKRK